MTLVPISGHYEHDIGRRAAAGVPLLPKRLGKTAAGTKVHARCAVPVAIQEIRSIPQTVERSQLPITDDARVRPTPHRRSRFLRLVRIRTRAAAPKDGG